MSPFQKGGVTLKGDMIVTPTTLFSQRAEPAPLWLRTLRERPIGRGTRRISRIGCEKAERGCASRVPLPPGVTARRTGGVLVVRATPHLFAASAARGRAKGDRGRDTLCPPLRRGRSHHSDPFGKAIKSLRIPVSMTLSDFRATAGFLAIGSVTSGKTALLSILTHCLLLPLAPCGI